MAQLSVNVNKVATVRNSRGGSMPSVLQAARVCLDAGAAGITVHPRADARHITAADVRDLAGLVAERAAMRTPGQAAVELNIEGDPRPDWLALVHEVRPRQATLVPVRPHEITSEAGWRPDTDQGALAATIRELQARGIRVSVFVDPVAESIEWAKRVGADRVELYTEPYSREFERGVGPARESFARYAVAAKLAHGLGLGINAGHDLDLDNLLLFRALPHLDEVSIGHALVSRALFVGLDTVVREYLRVLHG
ncbi:MAG TPA: pyridoxine 5'-phosphate synthase [Polyangiales bacterium]